MPGAADTPGGVLIAAALSSGGITDSVAVGGVADGAADGVDPDGVAAEPLAVLGVPGGGLVDPDGCSANVGTTIPGGGAATASGSSMSSTGRSGNAAWNGESVGALGSPVGATCLPEVSDEATVGAPSWGVRAKSDGELLADGGAATVEVEASAGRITFLVPVVAVSPGVALRAAEEVGADGALAADADGLLVGTAMGLEAPANVAPARLAAVLPLIGAWPGVTANAGVPDLVAPALRTAVAAAAARIFAAAAVRAALLAAEAVVAPGRFDAAGGVEGVAGPPDVFAAAGEAFAVPSDAVAALGEAAAAPTPFVPSSRAGAPGAEAPSKTSGSSSSPDSGAEESVGTNAESGRASGSGDAVETAGPSMPKSSSAPCESRSSSGSILPPFTADAAGADIEDEARPDGNPIPMGSSTGRSARGSKSEREAASIVFEPKSSGQS